MGGKLSVFIVTMFLVGTLHIPEPCILRIYRDNSVKNYLKDEDDGELEK